MSAFCKLCIELKYDNTESETENGILTLTPFYTKVFFRGTSFKVSQYYCFQFFFCVAAIKTLVYYQFEASDSNV